MSIARKDRENQQNVAVMHTMSKTNNKQNPYSIRGQANDCRYMQFAKDTYYSERTDLITRIHEQMQVEEAMLEDIMRKMHEGREDAELVTRLIIMKNKVQARLGQLHQRLATLLGG